MRPLQNLARNRKANNIQRGNLVPNGNNNPSEKQKKITKISIDSNDKTNINKVHNNSYSFNRSQSPELKNNEIEILEVIDEIPDHKIRKSKAANKNEIKNKLKDVKGKRTDFNEEIKMNENNKNLNKNNKIVLTGQINRSEQSKQKLNINCNQDITNGNDLIIAEMKNKIKVYEEKLKISKEIESKYKIENNNINEELKNYQNENIKLKKEIEIFKNKNNELIAKTKDFEKKNKAHNNQEDNILLSLYKKPTLIGLNNIGATCFMNSTLQCLSQTEALTNYFLKKSNLDIIINNNSALENKNSHQLSPIYLDLIQKLWDKKNENQSFSPNAFMEKVNVLNPLFKTGQAGDAKDFIIFVLEKLHNELKRPNKLVLKDYDLKNNQYDRESAYHYIYNDLNKDSSIISEIFFGYNETTNECLNCKKNYQNLNNPICYNYGIFNCLIFPLEEVKNMVNANKNNNINNNLMIFNNFQMNNMFQMNNPNLMNSANLQMNNANLLMSNGNLQMNNNNNILINNGNLIMGNVTQQNKSVTLYDCFCFNQKVDLFQGENRNYCNICKQTYDSYYTTKILKSPDVLILILNRGRGNIYDVKLIFDESIDITEFVQLKDRPKIIYNLYGVITHIGESGPNAHFVASCKSPINNKWYRYNDAFINSINDLQKEVIEFGTPYILFYQKKKY